MPPLHRGQAIGSVLLGVALGPDAEEPAIEQPDGAGEHALAPERPAAEMPFRGLAQAGQGPREAHHLVELLPVSALPPGGVVEVLSPARCIRPDRLDVAVRIRADPDVGPRRRDHESPDAVERLPLVDPLPVLV